VQEEKFTAAFSNDPIVCRSLRSSALIPLLEATDEISMGGLMQRTVPTCRTSSPCLEAQTLDTPDQQISLTDPDAHPMATSGEASVSWATMSKVAVVGMVSLAMARTHELL
jgi:hypothetical protein